MIIGITGGIASGKTTVSNILQSLGASVIDADIIAHQILEKGEKGWKKVINTFGKKILKDNGQINRKYLGNIVFNDKEKLNILEDITHPLIINKIKEEIQGALSNQTNGEPIFLDAPLLYETGLDRLVDEVWVIYIDRETQIRRVQQRDSLTREQAKKRIDAQLSLDRKNDMADVVIYNIDKITDLEDKIKSLWELYK